ncbi:hypothetical protein BBJ28_00014026 [Nothophytophthora sp. Chile5]|nr:hypothetical protein BBJ28_00014026 [Nothophytophthora sp. Chile5]
MVCTNHRATKLDGSLHKLCEFHRRKANLNQQKLHKRHREERAIRQGNVSNDVPQAKKACTSFQGTPDPSYHATAEASYQFLATNKLDINHVPWEPVIANLELVDMDMLELLLIDMQPLPILPFDTGLSSTSAIVEDKTFIM